MKNKAVINILIAYFVLLTIVLIIQIPKRNITANEPIASELKYEEKLKNAVVLYVGSPLAVINETQIIIDENDASITPEIVDGKTYIPVSILKTAFGATINWNKQNKETTIRYNNTAIIFKNESNSIKVVDNNSEKEEEIETAPLILHDRAYLPLRVAVDIFEKEVFYNNNLIIISDIKDIFDPTTEIDKLNLLTSQVNTLPAIGNEDKLKNLVGETNDFYSFITNNKQTDDLVEYKMNTESAVADYSDTNNQVDGVTEADIIKTDGEYIYYVRSNSVEIVDATKPESMNIASKIELEQNFSPQTIYIEDKKLVLIGDYDNYNQKASSEALNLHSQLSTVFIYNIENASEPTLLRKINTDGSYFDSRIIKNTLYFISTINVLQLFDGKNFSPTSYYDSMLSEERINTSFENIKYFPDMSQKRYTTVLSFDISDNNSEVDVNTYLGGGDDIYVSENNLYFACRKYNTEVYGTSGVETNIYKFNLIDGKAVYSKRANIDGAVLNQFSMDEKNNYFRVATTEFKNNQQSSNLFVLNSDFEKCGEIRDIAPGEKIYSTRFIGDRAYMVTFETVDPLFVINLKNPSKPEILGALKIPGYSNYLHPYDENHLIGLGKDTTVYEGNAYYKGVKLSMFDVSDVSNPKEMFNEIIGDRGTDSPALYDHKAFLFNKDKNILALPISLFVNNENDNELDYGMFAYQGAYVYSIDMEDGFVLDSRITDFSSEDMLKSSTYTYNEDLAVNRIIYIGDNLYTASNTKLVATNLKTFEKVGEVFFTDKTSEPTGELTSIEVSSDVILE